MERYFLPYDMSVKLKEKGLNIPFYFFYRTDDVDKQIHHSTSIKALEYSNKIIDDEVVIAPMYQQVFDWLRNDKNIDIEIDASVNRYIFGNKVYIPYISTYEEFTLDDSPETIRYRQNKINPPLEFVHFFKWEDAADDSIKYVIDELI